MFIEKLQFNEDTNDKTSFFYPFANDSIIEFGGEKEMQKMIGFYFKTKENSFSTGTAGRRGFKGACCF